MHLVIGSDLESYVRLILRPLGPGSFGTFESAHIMANSLPDAYEGHRVVRLLLRASGVLFLTSLGFVLLDVLLDVRLPGPLRASLPWLLLTAMLVGTTLLVGLLGMPGRPDRRESDAEDGSE